MATSTKGLADVPLRGKLSAKYTTSFAYPTIKDRCPVILCKIIDHLHRERINIGRAYGSQAQEGLKQIVDELSRLRYEMQTNKELSNITDTLDNSQVWNNYLGRERELGEGTNWYTASWMLAECYMYRRVLQSMHVVESLRDFDFFRHQKEDGFRESLISMEHLGEWYLASLQDSTASDKLLETLLQISLWGNKCDLSISAGNKQSATGNPIDQLQHLKESILCDQTLDVMQIIEGTDHVIDIVMDNAGYELFTDLCLADFLITSKKAAKVRFHLKNQPWFVSDTTKQDFEWTLNNLCAELDNKPSLSKLGQRWRGFLNSGVWELSAACFWTYPHVFSEMSETDPQLYSFLSQSSLLIFKGDLNYRKLVGDLNWETTVEFKTALKDFIPTNVLTLRTLKADVVTGLSEGMAEEMNKKDKEWMINGNWGVIQLAQLAN